MKPKLKIGLYAGFGLALALVILAAVFSYVTFNRQRREARWVEHTYEVITLSQRINRYVYEIESAGLTYRSTRDFRYLAPYFAQRSKLLPLVRDLRKMVSDNQEEVKRVSMLENNVISMLNFWEDLGIRHDSSYVFTNLAAITKEERKYLDLVHTGLTEIITFERSLLTIRNEQNNDAVARSIATLGVNTALILVVAIALMIISYRELNNRILAQRELRYKLKELVNLNETTNEKNWLLSGISQVSESLHGETIFEERAQKCLQALVSYLELPAGAVYHYDEDGQLLKLAAGVALPENPLISCKLNEGLIGQAATQK